MKNLLVILTFVIVTGCSSLSPITTTQKREECNLKYKQHEPLGDCLQIGYLPINR
jgi:hypothetical protein